MLDSPTPSPARSPAAAAPKRRGAQGGEAERSRERLLQAALSLFASQGFARTSTREIAELAGANLAAISYYFGDKAGLYRAVLSELRQHPHQNLARFSGSEMTLPEALRAYFSAFVEPLREGHAARQCMKLQLREMLEPTGLWQDEISDAVRSSHEALLCLLCRHLGLGVADDELTCLASSIAALGMHLHLGRELQDSPATSAAGAGDGDLLDLWLDRLVRYSLAMVDAERARRFSRT
jgi:AcrR family transcriptional regulator